MSPVRKRTSNELLGYIGVSSDIVQVILFLCNIFRLVIIFNIVNKMFLLYCKCILNVIRYMRHVFYDVQ